MDNCDTYAHLAAVDLQVETARMGDLGIQSQNQCLQRTW